MTREDRSGQEFVTERAYAARQESCQTFSPAAGCGKETRSGEQSTSLRQRSWYGCLARAGALSLPKVRGKNA